MTWPHYRLYIQRHLVRHILPNQQGGFLSQISKTLILIMQVPSYRQALQNPPRRRHCWTLWSFVWLWSALIIIIFNFYLFMLLYTNPWTVTHWVGATFAFEDRGQIWVFLDHSRPWVWSWMWPWPTCLKDDHIAIQLCTLDTMFCGCGFYDCHNDQDQNNDNHFFYDDDQALAQSLATPAAEGRRQQRGADRWVSAGANIRCRCRWSAGNLTSIFRNENQVWTFRCWCAAETIPPQLDASQSESVATYSLSM